MGESAAHVAAGALLSGVFASAGTAISPSVRTAATREVGDALDNFSVTSAVDNAAAASMPEEERWRRPHKRGDAGRFDAGIRWRDRHARP